MKSKSRIRLLITCLFTLVLSLTMFAFACGDEETNNGPVFGADSYASQQETNVPDGLEYFYDFVPEYKTYEGITVDGVVNEEEWAGKNKVSYSSKLNNIVHHFEFSVDFNKDGFVMYSKVTGGPMYYNYGRSSTANTGIEYYVATSASGEMSVSTTNRNYEIDIASGGYFLTKLRLRPASVDADGWCPYVIPLDVDITVHGTLNDPNSTEGWTTEWFMPWYAFGIDVPPTSIYVLPAYLFSASKTDKSATWYNPLSSEYVQDQSMARGNAWGNYADRLEFTENGYRDPNDDSVPVNIMNENPDRGNVVCTGTPESGLTVTAVPNEGYVVGSLNVNGANVNGSTYTLPAGVSGVTVLVSFIEGSELTNLDFSINITDALGGPLGFDIEGKKVMVATTYASQLATVTGGKLNVSLPVGTYTVYPVEFPAMKADLVVTSATAGTTQNVSLKTEVFSAYNSVDSSTTTASGTTVVLTDGAASKQEATFNSQLGTITWAQMRLARPYDENTYSSETGGQMIAIDGDSITWGTVWNPKNKADANKGWRFRFGVKGWTQFDMTADEYAAYVAGNLQIAVSIGNNVLYGFAKTTSQTEWRLVGSYGGGWGRVTSVYTNIKTGNTLYDINYGILGVNSTGLVNINTVVTSGAETGTASAFAVSYGGRITIKQSANAGYVLSSVKVNGLEYVEEVLAVKGTNNDINIYPSVPGNTYNVEVTFAMASTTNTITLSAKEKYASETPEQASTIASGTVYFYSTTGGESFSGSINNGVLTATVADGSYNVETTASLGSIPVTVENGQVVGSSALIFTKSIFASSNIFKVTADENGYDVTFPDGSKGTVANSAYGLPMLSGVVDSSKPIMWSFDYRSNTPGRYFTYLQFASEENASFASDSTNGVRLQFCHWDNALVLKWFAQYAGAEENRTIGVTLFNGAFVDKILAINVYINGSKVELYVDGELKYSFDLNTLLGQTGLRVNYLGVAYNNDDAANHRDWGMENMTVVNTNGYPEATVTLNGSKLSGTSVTAGNVTLTTSSSSIKVGDTVTYTLTPNAINGINTAINDVVVKVNGTPVSVTLSNNAFTYKLDKMTKNPTIDITATVVEKYDLTNVTVNVKTVKAVNGVTTKTPYNGAITFNGTSYTASAGVFTIPSIATGKYNVSIADTNYLSTSVVFEKDVTSYDVELNYNLLKVVTRTNNAWVDADPTVYNVYDAVNGNATVNAGTTTHHYMFFNSDLGDVKYVEAVIELTATALAGMDQYVGISSTNYGADTDPFGRKAANTNKIMFVQRYVSDGIMDGSTRNNGNNFTVRSVDTGWNQTSVKAVTSEAELTNAIRLGMYTDGSKVYLYKGAVDGEMSLWVTHTKAVERLTGINVYNGPAVKITGLKVYNEAPSRVISYAENADVTFASDNPTKVLFDTPTTLKVKANAGVIAAVKANGVALDMTTADADGWVTATVDLSNLGITRDIEITAETGATFNGSLTLNSEVGEFTSLGIKAGDTVEITLQGASYTLTSTLDSNLTASFENITAGTYDVKVTGDATYKSVTGVEFASDDTDKSATVQLIIGSYVQGSGDDSDSLNGNLTLVNDGVSGDVRYKFADYLGDIVYAEMTVASTVKALTVSEAFHTGFVTELAITNNNRANGFTFGSRYTPAGGADNSGNTFGAWQVRVMRNDAQPNYWTWKEIPEYRDSLTSVLRFAYVLDVVNSKVTAYYGVGAEGAFTYLGEYNVANTQTAIYGIINSAGESSSTISNLKVSTTVPAYLAPVNVTVEGETAGVTLGDVDETVAWGETATVNFKLASTYVASVKVDGQDVTYTKDADGNVSISIKNNLLAGSHNVVITVHPAPVANLTLSATSFGKAVSFDGATITAKGANGTYTAVAEDDSVQLTLPADTYTISTKIGGWTFTATETVVTSTEDVTKALTLATAEKGTAVVANATNQSVTDNVDSQGKLDMTIKNANGNFYYFFNTVDGQINYAQFTVTYTLDSSVNGNPASMDSWAFGIYNTAYGHSSPYTVTTAAKKLAWGINLRSGNWNYRSQDSRWIEEKIETADNSVTATLAWILLDGVPYVMIDKGNGFELYEKVTGAITANPLLGFVMNLAGNAKVSNIYFSSEIPEDYKALVTYSTNDEAYTWTAKPASVDFDKSATATLETKTLDNGDIYVVESITVNGKTVDVTNNGNVYSFTLTNTSINDLNVVVNTKLVQAPRNVSLTLNLSDDILMDKYVMEGAIVTFAGADGNVVASVGKNGALNAQLSDGEYTVTIPGYTPFTIAVNGTDLTAEETLTTTGVTANATVNANGGLTESEFTMGEILFANAFQGKVVYMEWNYFVPAKTLTGDQGGVWAGFTSTTNNNVTFGGHFNNKSSGGYSATVGNWGIRFGGTWHGAAMSTAQYAKFTGTEGLKVAAAVIDGVAYGLVEDGNGVLRSFHTDTAQVYTHLHRIGKNTASKFTNFKVATDLASVPHIVIQQAIAEQTDLDAFVNDNYTVTDNGDGSYDVAPADYTKNTIGSGEVIPFAFAGGNSLSFTFSYDGNDSGTKVFPSVYVYTGRGIYNDVGHRTVFQFCCWNGNWSYKISTPGTNGTSNVDGNDSTILNGNNVQVEIKGNASGKLAIYLNGTEFATSVNISTCTGFQFYYNYDGTYGYTSDGTETGNIVTWGFYNVRLNNN